MDQPAVSDTPPTLPTGKPMPAPGHFRPSRVLARWWWLAALVMIAITAIGYKTPDWLNMREPLYESTTLLEVKPIPNFDSTPTVTTTTHGTTGHTSRAFISTQEAIISASATLELAIKKNDLLNRLGGNPTEVLRRIQESLNVRQRYGTDLIEISYRDEDPALAQDTVTAIYQSYTERRTELEIQIRKNEVKALSEELYNQSQKVAELRKRLMVISAQLGISWDENGTGAVSIKLRDKAEKELYEANREKEQLKFQLEKLLVIHDDDAFLVMAEAIKADDPEYNKLHKEYVKENRSLQVLRAQGLGKEHPEIRMKTEAIKALKAKLKARFISYRSSLKHRLKLLESRIEKMKEMLNEQQDKGTAMARNFQEFNLARKEYRTARASMDQLQVKRDVAKVKLTMPSVSHIVHEEPRRPTIPVTKGREFFTTLFTLVALPLAAMGAFILIYLAEAIFPRRTA